MEDQELNKTMWKLIWMKHQKAKGTLLSGLSDEVGNDLKPGVVMMSKKI